MTQTLRRHWLLLVIACTLVVGGVLAVGTQDSSNASAASEGQLRGGIQAEWAHLYHDLPSLKRASDVAVVGDVSGIADQGLEGGTQTPYTEFSVTVQSVLFAHASVQARDLSGNTLSPYSTFIVHQLGGTSYRQQQPVQMEVADDPLFTVGDQVVLFLHQYSPGHYFVEGGPSGRFSVANGLVSPINDEGIPIPAPAPLAQFASEVSQA